MKAKDHRRVTRHLGTVFGVHKNLVTLGDGVIQAIATKQKINKRSSTAAELV
jgi:hypothetical protein